MVEVPLKKSTPSRVAHSEDAVNDRSYSDLIVPLNASVTPDYRQTFTESLILAQDERWRRA